MRILITETKRRQKTDGYVATSLPVRDTKDLQIVLGPTSAELTYVSDNSEALIEFLWCRMNSRRPDVLAFTWRLLE